MKRIIVLLSMIIALTFDITVFAGSVPEDLLSSDGAEVFFAEVVAYHPDKEKADIELSPTKVIKGDVKTGTKQIYYDPVPIGDFTVKTGGIYLFTYFDENNPTYFFETTTDDTATLKLINTQGDMWKRFEQYLNEGQYESSETKRLEKTGAASEDNAVIGGADGPTDVYVTTNTNISLILLSVGLLLIIGLILLIKKKRK